MKNKGARWLSASSKGAFAVVVVLVVAWVCLSETTSQTAAPVRASVPDVKPAPLLNAKASVASNPPALFYRHSVIPGGVRHSLALTSAISRDRFAQVHFANFDAANAYVVHVEAPRSVHVSYRMGDEIYWTKKKLLLTKGETLLTDGTSFVRTRCGNRIADTPQSKVSDKEPAPQEFDMVIAPPRGGALKRTPEVPSANTENVVPPTGSGGAIPRPPAWPNHDNVNPAPPIGWDGNPPLHPLPPPRGELPDDDPTQVPEPASFALAMIALFSLFLTRRRSQKK